MTDSIKAEQNHLYLVDGSAYIFRAYHRLPPLTNVHGEPVGAVYGYTTMLWKLADELNAAKDATHLAVVLDKSGTSFRNDLYDQYKANRPEAPEDLKPQFPMIRDATRAFSLPLIEEENVEADDMIASYTKAATEQGWKVTVVSSDKDLMQLIEPSDDSAVDMLDTMKNARMNRGTVEEKFGVGPEKLGDVLGLMGDSSDNIPGVPGIGPKTASKLINEFGDIESVLAAATGYEKIQDEREFDRVCRASAIVAGAGDAQRRLSAAGHAGEFAIQDIPEDPLKEFLSHHGFNSLLKKLGGDAVTAPQDPDVGNSAPAAAAKVPEAPPIDRSKYECVQTMEALDTWIARATEKGVCAVDLETDSLESVTARIVGVCLATGLMKPVMSR